MENRKYGAPVERGRVLEIESELATVASDSRPGLIARALPITNGVTVSVGDTVFFCLFEDGAGFVMGLCAKAQMRK